MFLACKIGGNDWTTSLGTIAIILLLVGLYYIVLRYTLFKTDWLIDKLSLDKHFTEEKFELNIHRSTVLAIGVIVIGAITFINSIPMFIREVYNYFGEKEYLHVTGKSSSTGAWIIFYGVKALMGYILMTNSRVLVNFIERGSKQTV